MRRSLLVLIATFPLSASVLAQDISVPNQAAGGDPDGILGLLEDWQTLIGAFLGFLAATFIGYRLNRRRDRALRKDDVDAIRSALYAEIIVLRKKIAQPARRIAWLNMRLETDQIDEQFLRDFLPPDPQIYPKLVDRFGMLSPEEFLPIARFYANYAEAKDSLPMVIEREEGPRYAPTAVLEPARNAIVDIEPTLRQIESELGFPENTRPDLGEIETMIEYYEDMARAYEEEVQKSKKPKED